MQTRHIVFVILSFLISCQTTIPENGTFAFPDGVASGDPQAHSVVLWTRAIHKEKGNVAIVLTGQISSDSTFSDIVRQVTLLTHSEFDNTTRWHADQLQPNSRYWYRFIAGNDTSRIGRTLTAPDSTQSATLNASVWACMSYEQGFYGTIRQLIEADKKAAPEDQIDVVFHAGDYIYEVVGDVPDQDNHKPKWLVANNGIPRSIIPFDDSTRLPEAAGWKYGSMNPTSIDDYWILYKSYLSNPVLQEARARWPFICTWDDHEFADANHQSVSALRQQIGEPGSQRQKVAANRAWFSYMPVALDHAPDLYGIPNPARDFKNVKVENIPLGDSISNGLYAEPNNLKAIGSMTIYRAFTWGKDILILAPDTKSYQLPGKTVLGEEQKQWFKDILESSTASWKLWLNSEPLLQTELDFDQLAELGMDRSPLYRDSWVQASHEQEELVSFISKREITGVVSLSGDYHIQMAGLLGIENRPIMADFATTAISAFPDIFWLDRKGKSYGNDTVHQLFAYFDEDSILQANVNTALMYGIPTAFQMAQKRKWELVSNWKHSYPNPLLQYADCSHNGYLNIEVNADLLSASFINTENARKDFEQLGAPIHSSVNFELALWKKGEIPELRRTKIEGEVFPGFK